MMHKSLLISTLLLLCLTYDMNFTCGTTNCPAGCTECQVVDGGPFSKISQCVDTSGGCQGSDSFVFGIGCGGCGTDCSYTISMQGQSVSGCVNADDQGWASLKPNLDLMYAVYVDPTKTYQWCTQSCGLSTGVLVAIIVGGAAVVGIAIVVIVKFMKKKKVQGNYQKM